MSHWLDSDLTSLIINDSCRLILSRPVRIYTIQVIDLRQIRSSYIVKHISQISSLQISDNHGYRIHITYQKQIQLKIILAIIKVNFKIIKEQLKTIF